MTLPQASPIPKLEASPAESLMSLPGDGFPSLFVPTLPKVDVEADALSPESLSDSRNTPHLPATSEAGDEDDDKDDDSPTPEGQGTPTPSEKKPAKKRKSWGQVLPEPKTNLPPRKRAKTDDEKEQRRVERVLRNRRAAQSSRERKRLEVEALERRNKDLETMLITAYKANTVLVKELKSIRRDAGVVAPSSSPMISLRDAPISLSPQLFSSQDGHNTIEEPVADLVKSLMNGDSPTVNPASISPPLSPVPDASEMQQPPAEADPGEQTLAAFPDLTQHPAEMLLDLQCQQSGKAPKSFGHSQTRTSPLCSALPLQWMLNSALSILSACQRPLMQIAASSKAGFSLLPTPHLLTTIIWLVTLPPASRNRAPSTSSTWATTSTKQATSSPTKQALSSQTLWQRATTTSQSRTPNSPSSTLRFKSLKNMLSSSPSLARPLMDATMEALRLVSEGCDDRVGGGDDDGSRATRGSDSELTRCLRGIDLPSREVLMTLLWALKVEERKMSRRDDASRQLESGALDHHPLSTPPTTKTFVLDVTGMKRASGETGLGGNMAKRHRWA